MNKYKNAEEELKALKEKLVKNGICTDCGENWVHHLDAPFASCGCKTGEDTTMNTPYMVLQKELEDAYNNIDELLEDR